MCIRASFAHPVLSFPALALLAVALGACGATGPRFHEVMAVAGPQEENTRVFVLRPAERWLDYRSSPAVVHLNGERIGRLLFDGFFYVDVPPGPMSLEVSARSSWYGVCRLSLEAAPGETVYLDVRVRTAYVVAGATGAIIGAELASADLFDPIAPPDDTFRVAEVAVSTIAGEIGAGIGSAAESVGKECGGPFVITPITGEEAMPRLDELHWSE